MRAKAVHPDEVPMWVGDDYTVIGASATARGSARFALPSPTLGAVLRQSRVPSVFVAGWNEGTVDFLVEHGEHIEILGLPESARDLRQLCRLPKLSELHLKGTQGYDSLSFAQLTSLRSLWLDAGPVDLAPLDTAPSLQALVLGGDYAIRDFRGFPELRALRSLKTFEMPLRTADGIERLPNLQELWIRQSPITDLDALRALVSLRSLLLYFLPKVGSIAALRDLSDLVSVDICSMRSVKDVDTIGSLARLQQLQLENIPVGDAGFLSSLVELRKLNLSTRVPLPSLAFLSQLKRLEWFGFDGKVTDNDLSLLLELPMLREAFVNWRRSYSPTEDVFKAHLAGVRNATTG